MLIKLLYVFFYSNGEYLLGDNGHIPVFMDAVKYNNIDVVKII